MGSKNNRPPMRGTASHARNGTTRRTGGAVPARTAPPVRRLVTVPLHERETPGRDSRPGVSRTPPVAVGQPTFFANSSGRRSSAHSIAAVVPSENAFDTSASSTTMECPASTDGTFWNSGSDSAFDAST